MVAFVLLEVDITLSGSCGIWQQWYSFRKVKCLHSRSKILWIRSWCYSRKWGCEVSPRFHLAVLVWIRRTERQGESEIPLSSQHPLNTQQNQTSCKPTKARSHTLYSSMACQRSINPIYHLNQCTNLWQPHWSTFKLCHAIHPTFYGDTTLIHPGQQTLSTAPWISPTSAWCKSWSYITLHWRNTWIITHNTSKSLLYSCDTLFYKPSRKPTSRIVNCDLIFTERKILLSVNRRILTYHRKWPTAQHLTQLTHHCLPQNWIPQVNLSTFLAKPNPTSLHSTSKEFCQWQSLTSLQPVCNSIPTKPQLSTGTHLLIKIT